MGTASKMPCCLGASGLGDNQRAYVSRNANNAIESVTIMTNLSSPAAITSSPCMGSGNDELSLAYTTEIQCAISGSGVGNDEMIKPVISGDKKMLWAREFKQHSNSPLLPPKVLHCADVGWLAAVSGLRGSLKQL